jgi:hypothetical protein
MIDARNQTSPLFVEGIAQAIAIHLARNFAETTEEPLTVLQYQKVSVLHVNAFLGCPQVA